MLTKLRIVNFKCLKDTGELDIRPLTFLVGPNSSGKSSVLQILLMLRQTVDSIDTENALTPNDGWVKLGAYSEFVFGQDTKRELGVELWFDQLNGMDQDTQGSSRTKFSFRYNQRTTQVGLYRAEMKLDTEGASVLATWSRGRRGYTGKIVQERQGEHLTLGPIDVVPKKFYQLGTTPTMKQEVRTVRQMRRILGKPLPEGGAFSFGYAAGYFEGVCYFLAQILERMITQIVYLGPLRQRPERSYGISGRAPMDVGTSGERTAEVLWYATRTRESREKLLTAVDTWLKRFNIALEVRMKRLGRSSQYSLLFVDPSSGLNISLADVGFGASQVLPVIVQGFYSNPGSLLLIEQPEIHLHPKAQATLGHLLVEIAKKGDRRLIVESHSDHVLGRVQRCIAEEEISADDVAIYYFEPTPDGTNIHHIKLDEYGQFENFPEGFFEESFREAIAHSTAIRSRMSHGE